MAKSRSPQYPIVSLQEAINKARLVWEKDYQSELPREVIAEHMGYKSLNGKSLGILSTVGKYGLLEGRGDQTKVSDLAVQIFAHDKGEAERADAIQKAAAEPVLFKDIAEKFGSHSPSDQALKSYLITRGFTLSATDSVIRSFRDTEQFVKSEVSDYDSETQSDDFTEEDMQTSIPQPVPMLPSPASNGVPTISMSDNGLEIGGGVITSIEQFEKLMRRLSAGKMLLEPDED